MAASETVRVIVRCRPMNQRELDLKCQTIVTMNTQSFQVMLENIEQRNEPPKQFTFDAVYPEDSITENLYAESVFPLVESVLEGYNATVFAYGQTGCGKSFTMQGLNTPGSPQRGVIPRAFEHIFDASSTTAGTKYLIRASYLEIYNESIRDLLGKDVKAALDLKEYVDKGVQVQNLTWHPCSSVVDCERLMDKGNRNRATGATLMNKDSSRSHSIFTIVTEMCTRSEVDGKEHIRAGKLNLVDLAGSERQSKTHAEGDRLREATRINLSLSALGNVISALVDGRSKHIPYRDSKLTRLLQDSLGGNTKTLMIAAVSPAHDNYDETLSTLRYANRAKNIKNKPRINEDPRDAQMKLLQDEINRLKQELISSGGPSRGNQVLPPDTNTNTTDHDDELEKEKERLRNEFEREVSEMRRQYENERLTKEEIQKKYDDLKVQYDTELDALNTQQPKEDVSSTNNKTKKKGGVLKQKRDGDTLTNDEEIDGDNSSDPTDPTDPTNPTNPTDPKQKLQRLQELENKLVGGEEINNEDRKKKRKKKLNDMKEKNEHRKRFNNAINGDDDDTMMRVFDDAQEQINFTAQKLEEQRLENKRLNNDNEDLQHEFQREREGYLTTIREQEKKLLLYKTMVEKMSQIVPRSCNYSNTDKIIEQARYDEDRNIYHLPDPTREEVQFPQMGNLPTTSNGRQQQNGSIFPSNGRTQQNGSIFPSNGRTQQNGNIFPPNGRTQQNGNTFPPNGRTQQNGNIFPPNGRTQQNGHIIPSKSISTTEYEDDFVRPNEYSTTNTEDIDKNYRRNYDSSNGPTTNTEDIDKHYGRNYDSPRPTTNTEDIDKRYGRNYDSPNGPTTNVEDIDKRYGRNYDSPNGPTTNTEDIDKRYGRNYDSPNGPTTNAEDIDKRFGRNYDSPRPTTNTEDIDKRYGRNYDSPNGPTTNAEDIDKRFGRNYDSPRPTTNTEDIDKRYGRNYDSPNGPTTNAEDIDKRFGRNYDSPRPTTNTEDIDKRYGRNYDSPNGPTTNTEDIDKRFGRNYDSPNGPTTNAEDIDKRFGRNYDSPNGPTTNAEEIDKRYGRNYDSLNESTTNSEDIDKRFGRNYDSPNGPTTNTEDIDKRYGRNYDSSNGPTERARIKRQEYLLNESSLLQRTKRPLQTNDNDYMNRRLNPYEAPARLSRKYGFSSDKQ